MSENTTQKGTVNGVNVDDLFATIAAITDKPVIAKFQFRASNEWQGGGLNRTKINEFEGACEQHTRTLDLELIGGRRLELAQSLAFETRRQPEHRPDQRRAGA